MIDVDIDTSPIWGDSQDWKDIAQNAVHAAIEYSAYKKFSEDKKTISISIKLSDNDEINALNKQYRNKDKPTNILSFPLIETQELDTLYNHQNSTNPNNIAIPEILLGDLILAYSICRDEANSKSISLADHFTHLIIHGVLHLIGYDHIIDNDANVMQSIEIKALKKLGLDDPYE